ncbi:transposase-like protein [Hirsutella rhossiliensis]
MNSKAQPSIIYKHGAQLTTDGDNKYWLCKYCHVSGRHDTALFASESTTSIIYHLRHHHKLAEFGYKVAGSDPFSISQGATKAASYLGSRRMVFNDLQFRSHFADWVIDLDLTFRQATHRRTNEIFALCLEDIDKVLPKSPSALSSWVSEKWFGDNGRRAWLKEQLRLSKSKIHVSTDAWTSEEVLKGPHTGENIAKVLAAVMGSYEIGQNVGFFMMDNASSNDTCIRELAKRYPVIKPQSRLRCVGHMLNLIVKALLFGQGVGKLEKQLCGASEVERFEIWRKHSFRAVKLRHAIDLFFLNYCYGGVGYDISQDVLTPQDWIDLHHFLDILKPFKDLTKRMEGRANKAGLEGSHGSLHETIESFDVLFKKLQEAGRFADDHPDVVSTYYSHAIDAARIKLEEYFGLTDATPAYRCAVALHPANKFA